MGQSENKIEIVHHKTGEVTYNGYQTVYEALYNMEHEFRQLDFASRMLVTIDISNDIVEENITVPQKYYFIINGRSPEEMVCSLYHYNDIVDPVIEWEWNELHESGIMMNINDIDSLHQFLVYTGEILPHDVIVRLD